MERAIVILAAGRGERMNSETPKVMHKIAGAPMIMHTLRTAKSLDPDRIIVINTKIQRKSINVKRFVKKS